jgi:hypothetical protein
LDLYFKDLLDIQAISKQEEEAGMPFTGTAGFPKAHATPGL